MGAAELALRLRESLRTPLCVRVTDARLYGLNPKHPGISSLGFRNREIVLPKPPNTYRVVVIGDSVAYGTGVPRSEAFPQRMHRLLAQRGLGIEVINCGVPGYSTYNEVELYRNIAARLQPDLVVLAFCLNDIVSPRLHWATAGYALGADDSIPQSAIPDPDHDRDHVRPMIAARTRMLDQRSFLTRSLFVSALFDALVSCTHPPASERLKLDTTALAFEDSTSIKTLLSDASPQWRWLMKRIAELDQDVSDNGAKLIVLFFPLAYQMDRGYSHSPQHRLTNACTVAAIPSIDMLPILDAHPKSTVFRLSAAEYYDIWHLTSRGHEVVAEALAPHLLARRGEAQSRP